MTLAHKTGFEQNELSAYPRTGISSFFDAFITSRKRTRLSSIVQFMFAFEKDSEAEPKTAISFAPAATAASKPWPKPNHINYTIIQGRNIQSI